VRASRTSPRASPPARTSYLALEYALCGQLTDKSDVYSLARTSYLALEYALCGHLTDKSNVYSLACPCSR
jgi:hypothetical protein